MILIMLFKRLEILLIMRKMGIFVFRGYLFKYMVFENKNLRLYKNNNYND